ncbi:MAG: hypothetical protein OXF41_04835 [bacterium]|nr:hypothetical protein [bacterium]
MLAPTAVLIDPSPDLMVYPVTGAPPSSDGANQLTVSSRSPSTTAAVGGPGTPVVSPPGVPLATAAGPAPISLVAVTSIVYSTPLVRLAIITRVSETFLRPESPWPLSKETV